MKSLQGILEVRTHATTGSILLVHQLSLETIAQHALVSNCVASGTVSSISINFMVFYLSLGGYFPAGTLAILWSRRTDRL